MRQLYDPKIRSNKPWVSIDETIWEWVELIDPQNRWCSQSDTAIHWLRKSNYNSNPLIQLIIKYYVDKYIIIYIIIYIYVYIFKNGSITKHHPFCGSIGTPVARFKGRVLDDDLVQIATPFVHEHSWPCAMVPWSCPWWSMVIASRQIKTGQFQKLCQGMPSNSPSRTSIAPRAAACRRDPQSPKLGATLEIPCFCCW